MNSSCIQNRYMFWILKIQSIKWMVTIIIHLTITSIDVWLTMVQQSIIRQLYRSLVYRFHNCGRLYTFPHRITGIIQHLYESCTSLVRVLHEPRPSDLGSFTPTNYTRYVIKYQRLLRTDTYGVLGYQGYPTGTKGTLGHVPCPTDDRVGCTCLGHVSYSTGDVVALGSISLCGPTNPSRDVQSM